MLDPDVFAIKTNFIAESILPKLDSLIVSSFLKFLDMVEVLLANNYQLS